MVFQVRLFARRSKLSWIGGLIGGLALVLAVDAAMAQTTTQTTTPASSPAVAAPATEQPAASPPAATAPVTAPPATIVPPKTELQQQPDQAPLDPATTPFDLAPRPVALLRGKATWEEGYKVIHENFKKITDALAVEKIAVAGKPLAVFVETNDQDFKYEIMIPIEKAPEGKTGLAGDIVFGMSPGGKVLKFQHRGAYDDIDSTYEAITAYLDEKGFESKDLFAEEYLNETKGSDDTSMQLDVYVYLK
jgi:effector-binding domain-containing protein